MGPGAHKPRRMSSTDIHMNVGTEYSGGSTNIHTSMWGPRPVHQGQICNFMWGPGVRTPRAPAKTKQIHLLCAARELLWGLGLAWYGVGTVVLVWSWYSCGKIGCGFGVVLVWIWFGFGMVVWFRYCVIFYTILYYTILYYTILYCTVLYCTALYYSLLIFYYTIL